MKENELYEGVQAWLDQFLRGRYRGKNVRVFDSHKVELSRLIADQGLQPLFPEFNAWDVKVDVTGLVSDGKAARIALVECKIKQLTLRDVGQLLGYSIVVRPILSILTSPCRPSDPLRTLLKDYGRLDVLQYGPEKRHIRLAEWNLARREIVLGSIIPRGPLI